jgi:protein ImuA
VEDQPDQTICLEELRRRIARLEGQRRDESKRTVSSGSAALDDILPKGGFCRGTLVEWLSPGEGAGAWTLALLAAREACRDGGALVVLDRRGEFCPPAAVRLGIEPRQLIVVRAESAADADWATDQVLRSPAVAATLAWPEKLDGRTFRRWQLAVEQHGGLGFLLRPATARADPSWADVRLWVEPLPTTNMPRPTANIKPRPVVAPLNATTGRGFMVRRLRIVLLRCRGAADGGRLDVELDDETYRVHPVRLPIEKCKLQIAN